MVGMPLVLAYLVMFSSVRADYCPIVDLTTQEGGEYDELVELNLPAQLSDQSVEVHAFVISIQLQDLLNYIHTLTSSPNFPYVSTEDLQKLADLADKLTLIDEIIVYDVNEASDYDLSE